MFVRMPRALRSSLSLLAVALAACTGGPGPDAPLPEIGGSFYALVSTIDGTAFYPPLGPDPVPTGAFDASLLGELRVVLEATSAAGDVRSIATFDASTTPNLRLVREFEVYFVDVPAAIYFTDPSSSYRFRVLLGAAELGRSDLSSRVFDVLAKNPGLLVGVKLRIEARSAPVVASVAPSTVIAGAADTPVTISGSGFVGDSALLADDEALVITARSSTSLTAVVPARLLTSAGALALSVRTPAPGGGTSSAATLTIQPAQPVLSAVSPARFTLGQSSALTVIGASFAPSTYVTFDGTALATTFVSDAELRAVVPAALLATAGSKDVSVATPGGGAATAAVVVENPATTITALTPASVNAGSAFTLTVDGAGFVPGATVLLNGAALVTTYVSATRLTAAADARSTRAAGLATVVAENPSPAVSSGSASLRLLGLAGDACSTTSDCAAGVCSAGVCDVSNLTLASNESCVDAVAVTSSDLYYVTRSAAGAFSLRRVPTTGGAAATVVPTLGSGYTQLMVGDDTHLLWRDQSTFNTAWTYTVGSAAPATLPYALRTVSGGQAIGTIGFNSTFVSASVSNLTATTVLGAVSPLADEVVRADGYLFWSRTSAPYGFYRMPLTGGTATLFHEDATTPVDPFSGTAFWGLRAANGYLYWFQASGTGYALMRKPTSGGVASVVATMTASERLSSGGIPLVVDGTSAYWSAGGAIRTVPLTGGTVSVFRTLGSLSALGVDANAVYAATCGGNTGQVVMRYLK